MPLSVLRGIFGTFGEVGGWGWGRLWYGVGVERVSVRGWRGWRGWGWRAVLCVPVLGMVGMMGVGTFFQAAVSWTDLPSGSMNFLGEKTSWAVALRGESVVMWLYRPGEERRKRVANVGALEGAAEQPARVVMTFRWRDEVWWPMKGGGQDPMRVWVGSYTRQPAASVTVVSVSLAGLSGVGMLLCVPMGCWIRRLWRQKREGACGECGYDLRGNESGRCPECGKVVV